MNAVPVLKSTWGDIVSLKYVRGIGALFAVSDKNSIYRIDEFPHDAMGRGLVYTYGQILNGEGDFSEVVNTHFYYDMYNAIIQLDGQTSDFDVVKDSVTAYTVEKNTKVTALYVSDVLKADEDFGFWKTITWKQTVDLGRVVVALKVAETEEELATLGWQYYISENPESNYTTTIGGEYVVVKDLDKFNLKGRFMRFKVGLEATDAFEVPVVSEFVITYAAKHAVFFFTRKIKVSKGSNIDNIVLTATYSTPSNTEVRFGLTNSNSANWEEYRLVNLDELISLPSDWGNAIKVGVKLSSYSDVRYPVVQQLAFLLGTDTDNELNQS